MRIFLFTNIYYIVLKSGIMKTTYTGESITKTSMTFSANVVNDQKHTIHRTLQFYTLHKQIGNKLQFLSLIQTKPTILISNPNKTYDFNH